MRVRVKTGHVDVWGHSKYQAHLSDSNLLLIFKWLVIQVIIKKYKVVKH